MPVLERLSGIDLRSAGLVVHRTAVDIGTREMLLEARAVTASVEARVEDERFGLVGDATTFDEPYDVFGGPERGGWTETFAAGSMVKTVAESRNRVDDVRFLVNHEGLALARTNRGTLLLDASGPTLRCEVPALNMARPDAQTLWHAIADGDCDRMSIAFIALRQEWNADFTERIIREAQLFDVSAVTFPANPNTFIGIRADESATRPRSVRFAAAELDALGV